MDCGDHCIKYILFFFNFIFVLCGLGLLIPGIIIQSSIPQLEEFKKELIDQGLTLPSTPLIVVGGIIFVIAFFGCCGAIRESHCMIVTYAVLLLTVLIIQIAIGVFTFLGAKHINENTIKSKYELSFSKYWSKDEGSQSFIDGIQSTLHCCGVEGKNDFSSYPNFNSTIPWSCCPQKDSDKQFCNGHSDIYNNGCAKTIVEFFRTLVNTLGGIALGIAGVEFVGVIFALCLANSIKNSERRAYRV